MKYKVGSIKKLEPFLFKFQDWAVKYFISIILTSPLDGEINIQ